MKRFFIPLCIFLITFFIYFAVGTNFSFKPKWVLDYFNQFAQSLLHLRLDIPNPQSTYDLAYYEGKWYLQWGFLPALFLIPFQLVMGRFIPTIYVNILFSSLSTLVFYFLLIRVRKDFLPKLSLTNIILNVILFTFGTTHFYVGTLGGVWHVSQMVSFFFGLLSTYVIFKAKRKGIDYFLSATLCSLTLIGRPTVFSLISLPIFLYLWDVHTSKINKILLIKQGVIFFALPIIFFSSLLFLYNYFRFENIFQFGYAYIADQKYLINQSYGISSIGNIPQNAWYMLFEIPSLSYQNMFKLNFNLNGNSIFFLTPPFFAIFLASLVKKEKRKYQINPYIASLWFASIVTMIPILMHFSSGFMQFGYRYSLDITVLLLLLSVFGVKGKMHLLYVLGVAMAIFLHVLGIQALM